MAQDSDFERIFLIWKEGIKETFPSLSLSEEKEEKFKNNFFNRKPFHFWIAERDNEVIGWQSHIPCTNNPVKFQLYAETSIYVSKEFRGSKAAYLLYSHSLKFLKDSTEIMFLFGQIALNNVPALKIATSFGFEQIGIIPECNKNGNKIESKCFVVNTLKPNTKI